MDKIGLVLEGGAMRGMYTTGVLDFFIREKIDFDYIIGVSAGSIHGCSYVTKQLGRDRKVSEKYSRDNKYMGVSSLISTGGIFGFEYMFKDIATKGVPFDYKAFKESPVEFVVGVTNCITGKAEYFYKNQCDLEKIINVIIASASMPLLSKEVIIDGKAYLDGGVSDSIPVKKALEDGCEKVVIILTRNKGYIKKPNHSGYLAYKAKYVNYKEFLKTTKTRYKNYNETIQYIEEIEKQGKAFVIRPSKKMTTKRMERNKRKLLALHREGYFDAKNCGVELKAFING